MPKFVHLHGHSEYSLLDGLSKIPKLVKEAKELGMEALALTDHGVMYGAIEFYKACVSEGIKPIIGCELYIAPRSHKTKEGKVDTEPFHLTVLAKDLQGYRNLMKLVSISHLEGYYYRPRVDKALLKEYHQGLIALSGCPSGEFIRSLESKDPKKGEEVARSYLEIFGDGNFFFEVQRHPYALFADSAQDSVIKGDLERMQQLQDLTAKATQTLSTNLGIPIVATNDFHYIKREDATFQDAILCVQTGKQLLDVKRLRMIDAPDYYLKSPEEMAHSFTDLPEAIKNSVKIAKNIDLSLELGKTYLPLFSVPENKDSDEYLKELTYKGASEKLEMTDEVGQRLEYELDIITYKKYSNYFLIVQDFMNWAHEEGIITNTRGSAAGSLVLYCLGVTNLNPLDYLIPFERFLTKSRPTLPDIDADLADDRRDEVISYVMSKYGQDRVAHIVTFGTMMGRAAIRDIGRVMGMSYSEVDRIAKLVPPPHQGFHKPLQDAIKEVLELKDLYKNDLGAKKLLDMAVKIEGTVRHASVHAAGIVIAPSEITDFTPLQKESNGDKVVTQYDMFSIMDEYGGAGLVKMDFLGIRNLSILGRAVEYVKDNKGINVDINNIPLEDKKTFELLARGETMGVFQLSSEGMTKNLVELRPTRIQDISAMVALYRPGPMGVIPEYIKRKHNSALVDYYDPRMRQYLEQSLGLLVYQDDVLLTVINIAGYSWEEADKFRKAMGKKNPAEMAKQKDKFIEGCVKNGLSQKKSERLYELIAPFAAYGFNKAHAASYAMVAYQTAYMKANFPVEFMAAVMTAEYGDIDKIAAAIAECKKMGIVVLQPDVNKSKVGFTIEDLDGKKQGIRFGLSAIKNVGVLAIESILKARAKGEFKSLADLCSRVDARLVNRKTLESLIKAGAMDSLGIRAAQLLVLDECLGRVHKMARRILLGQASLFGEEDKINKVEVSLPQVEELSLDQMLTFEKDLLGFYLHEPPYLALLAAIGDFCTHKISDLTDDLVGVKVKLGGVITEVKKVLTKKSSAEMAFVRLSDGVGEIEIVVFPTVFSKCSDFLEKDRVVLAWGRIDKREEQKLSMVSDNLSLFDPVADQVLEKELEINVPKGTLTQTLMVINKTLRDYPGRVKVSIILPNGGSEPKRMNLPFGVKADQLLIETLEQILGVGTIRLT